MFVFPNSHNNPKENEAYSGHFVKVREVNIGGALWEKVYLRHACLVFPWTERATFVLVKEKRPQETPNTRIKAITGHLEPGMTIEENVNKEMQEEVGLKANHIDVFDAIESTGTVNNKLYIAFASHLSAHKIPNPDGEETIMETLEYTPEELIDAVINEDIPWGLNTLAFLKLKKAIDSGRLVLG